MKATLIGVLLTLLAIRADVYAQRITTYSATVQETVQPTSTETRMESHAQRLRLRAQSLVADVPLANIGPTVMSGRVVDLDVNPQDPTVFYAAYASGGLWRTTTNGISFEPLFEDQASMTLGDIAVDWAHGETIWAGTGESNASRSSYAGTGIYKSTDRGKTWTSLGLAATQRTSRIVLHPDDPQTVWVAAQGPLYSASEDRGVYKTTDGGATWRQTLYVDENTGAVDLAVDPSNPNILYAALWHRERRAWNFVESGSGSGIYKTTDGGESWILLSGPDSGFPMGDTVGRIGLAVFPDNPSLLYALLDNQARRPEEPEEEEPALTRDSLRGMTRDAFLALADEDLEAYLRDNGFPEEHTAASIKTRVRAGTLDPESLVWYLEDANRELFDTPVIGAEVYRSDDGGRTWSKTHEDYLEGLYYSYGYYFGQIRVDPRDADRIYVMGVPILRSDDGGRTFTSINESNVHVDHHALWIDPERPGHLINGNDGGVNVSYDDGATWFKANTPSVGQFYTVQVDDATPYNVYGGLQDNGVWVGPHTYEASYGWYGSGDYPYDRLLGGDGMQVEVDTRTNDVVYTGSQFGSYSRIERSTGRRQGIRPQHELGERPLRFNWQTPIHLSRHNQDILYLGSNKLHRSFNRGEDWETLSGDLTLGGRTGDVPYGTLTTIDESPLRFGLLYVGSDDGLVHVSHDAGASWQRITEGLPPDLWVSRVEASAHRLERVYVTLNGYRWDNFEPHLYRSDDYGTTWVRLGTDLPMEPVNVVLEDPENERILYVGTDHGLYISLDGGESFMGFGGGLPDVPIHDLKVQGRERDLVVGTHGRSLFRADVTHVQQLTPELLAEPLHLFALEDVTYRSSWGNSSAAWREPGTPDLSVPFFAGTTGQATFRVTGPDDLLLREWTEHVEAGLHYAAYDLSADPERVEAFNENREDDDPEAQVLKAADNGAYYLIPGTYTVHVALNGTEASQPLAVKEARRGGSRAPRSTPLEEGERE